MEIDTDGGTDGDDCTTSRDNAVVKYSGWPAKCVIIMAAA